MKAFVAIIFLLPIINAYTVFHSDKRESPAQCIIKNGGFGNWGEWHYCSVTCGTGTQKRYRHCDNPRPMYGGSKCSGETYQVRNCDSGIKCPIDGGWGVWEKGSCSVQCGDGTRTITRSCNNPPPTHCGQPCNGEHTKHENCNLGVCPKWGEWVCGSCFSNKVKKTCEKKCTRKCISGICVGGSSRSEICSGEEKQKDCPESPVDACDKCHEDAIRTNDRGLYCRVEKSDCDGLHGPGIRKMYQASGWYYLHCSNDGPWCKPCAEKFLVYNSKCGTCEETEDGPCTDTASTWKKPHEILNDVELW